MTQRVTIVGAGPGGLAAALLMACHGADVTVIERRDRVGGRCSAIEADGFRFDTGPTFFLYPRILEEIFEACGARLADHVELRKLDPMYRLVFEGGGDIRASDRIEELQRQVAALNSHDAANLPAFMEDGRRKLDAFRPVLENDFGSLAGYLRPQVLKALRYMRPQSSVDRDLSQFFDDPRVRLAFSFQSKYLGMSPFRCPSLFTILSYLEYGHGVHHPIGGCASVVEAMAALAVRMGVTLKLNEDVEGIEFDGRRARAVVTDRGRYPCDALVLNADFAHAMNRLVPDALRRRWKTEKLDRKKFSCSTYMMWLGLDGRVDLDHHTIFLSQDYKRNIRQIEEGREVPDRPSLYVQNAGATDPTLAPAGKRALYVLVPVPHQSPHIDWRREAPRYRELVLDRLEKDVGIPDLRRRIQFERVFTPDDWRDQLHVYKGATFNLAHNLGQMLYFRPHNRFEDLDGVYLVGGGTHPGSGLPVIFEGARITSRLIVEDLGLTASAVLDTGRMPALEAAE